MLDNCILCINAQPFCPAGALEDIEEALQLLPNDPTLLFVQTEVSQLHHLQCSLHKQLVSQLPLLLLMMPHPCRTRHLRVAFASSRDHTNFAAAIASHCSRLAQVL
jgi:hypothetical protein